MIDNTGRGALAALQRFVRKPRAQSAACELCAAPLPPVHQHLLELEKRRVTCACDPCAILFGGNARQRYRRIPRDLRRLHNFVMDDHEWESLLIPINLAFFVHSSAAGRVVAQYPSPGGAMESSLDLEYWNAIVERNPMLKQFEPDVEALLVNRLSSPRYISRSHRPVLPSRGHHSHELARSLRWPGGVEADRPLLRRTCASQRRGAACLTCAFRSKPPKPLPTRPRRTITFKVRATDAEKLPIHSIALRVQVQIEPPRRRYTPEEQENLRGAVRRARTLEQIRASAAVDEPQRQRSGLRRQHRNRRAGPLHLRLQRGDHEVHLWPRAGEIPITLLFSGTVFHAGRMGLQVAQIPWDRDASYRLPVQLWKEMMDFYYPNTAWLCLHREVFDKLYKFKAQHGIPTWEQALERILA